MTPLVKGKGWADAESLADALAEGAALELRLTPKPGLVDLAGNGSHPDLSYALMERSIGFVADCLREMAASVGRGEDFPEQAAIARRAENRMRGWLGANTHKGYVFLSGLLLIARARAGSDDEPRVRGVIGALARDHFKAAGRLGTHGERARGRFRVGGIVREALDGFPSVFCAALPAYREAIGRSETFEAASFFMLARLMQVVEDTTALHRCGEGGLRRIRRDGRLLEETITGGGDAVGLLVGLGRDYRRTNLTMGGVADLLGLAYGWLVATGEISRGLARNGARINAEFSFV
jgi:triphosphoribosyl-dephospho-CoA synthase